MTWGYIGGAAVSVVGGALLSDDGGGGGGGGGAAGNPVLDAISKEQWDSYKKTYQPKEEQFVNESFAYDTPENRLKKQNEAIGLAATTTSQQFNRARQQLQRSIDPSNRGYANAMAGLGLQEAAARAGNMTMAGRNASNRVEDLGRAYKTDALSLGKGLAAGAASAAGQNASIMQSQNSLNQQMGLAQAGAVGRLVGNVINTPGFQSGVGNMFGGSGSSQVPFAPGYDGGYVPTGNPSFDPSQVHV